MNFSRRDFITYLRNILGTASVYPFIANNLSAQDSHNNEHYFIFVELKGGAHHTLIADYPDPDQIKSIQMNHPEAVMFFDLPSGNDRFQGFFNAGLSNDYLKILKTGLVAGGMGEDGHEIVLDPAPHRLNGYFCALPDGDNFRYIDGKKRLGPAGLPLHNLVNQLSVVRGVYMQGNFHGIANKEIFSGDPSDAGPHVAGVLTKLLGVNKLALDNIVIDGATYTLGSEANTVDAPIRLSLDALATLASNDGGFQLNHGKILAETLNNNYRSNIIDAYIEAFADAQKIKDSLKEAKFSNRSGSLAGNIEAQLNLCLHLFEKKLARVATICVGNVDGFGGFDSHDTLYSRFYPRIKRNMQDLANFINTLKGHKTLKDRVTLVVSSEFGRSNNFSGNADTNLDGEGHFGNDHYYFNNNYLFYGKNVETGQWLGESDPVTRYPYICDMEKLANGETLSFESPVNIVDIKSNKKYGKKIVLHRDFTGGALRHLATDSQSESKVVVSRKDNKNIRAIMAKDIVRTIMKIAGVEDSFSEYYPGENYRDARIIKQLISR